MFVTCRSILLNSTVLLLLLSSVHMAGRKNKSKISGLFKTVVSGRGVGGARGLGLLSSILTRGTVAQHALEPLQQPDQQPSQQLQSHQQLPESRLHDQQPPQSKQHDQQPPKVYQQNPPHRNGGVSGMKTSKFSLIFSICMSIAYLLQKNN